MKKVTLSLCIAVGLGVVLTALGSMPRNSALSDDSPAFGKALTQAIQSLDGVTSSTLNPTRVDAVRAQNLTTDPADPNCQPTSDPNDPACTPTSDPADPRCQPTYQPGGPTCDGTVTCVAYPTYVPITCRTDDPECDYPNGYTADPAKCDPHHPTWDATSPTCHVGGTECVQPTMQLFRTCDTRYTCYGAGVVTCDGSFTHWNSTCLEGGQTCDGAASPTCVNGLPGSGPWTCTHFTVDGSPTCNGVYTCRETCDQWYTCRYSATYCPTPNAKTSWGSVKTKYRK